MPNPGTKFEWHDDKNQANVRKHGIRFEDATRILEPDGLVLRGGTGEENRWKTIGLLEGRVITVVFTERAGRRRLISARPASRSERRTYNRSRSTIQMGMLAPKPTWDESKQVPDEEIDFSDIPDTEPWEWKYARPMSHPEAFSKELSEAYDAEWRARKRRGREREDKAKKPNG